MAKLKYLCVHETLVERTNTPQLYAVNAYHKQKFGARSSLGFFVGYHAFCDFDGTITKTRVFGESSCAVIGHNCNDESDCDTYSVCFALSGDFQTFNAAQIKSWKEIAKEHPEAEITLHRNLQPNRTCPGKLITVEYLKNLLTPDNTPIEDVRKTEMANYMGILDSMKAMLITLLSLIGKR